REAPEPAFPRLQPQEPEPPGRAAADEAPSEGKFAEREVVPGTIPMAEMPERDVAELATELAGLAGRIAAQTCQFLVLLGDVDARAGWGQYARIPSCAHWLSWQGGMSNSTDRKSVG